MQEKITVGQSRYGDMIEALNKLYWDGDVSPEETVALLEKFGNECFRLAKFVQGNIELLDPPARTSDEADLWQDCPICGDSGIDPDSPDGLERPCPNCGGHS